MEDLTEYGHIVERLKNRMPFGLFSGGDICVFKDGTKISYAMLWKAIKIAENVKEGAMSVTLFQLYPDSFIGVHSEKYSKLRFAKQKNVLRKEKLSTNL